MSDTPMYKLPLDLPSLPDPAERRNMTAEQYDALNRPCGCCGGAPTESGECEAANGLRSMYVDHDLCIECAVLLWRVFKRTYPDTFQSMLWKLLAEHPATYDVMRAARLPLASELQQ